MKKNTFIILLVLCTFFILPQNAEAQTEYKLDSVQVFYWDDPIAPTDWLMQIRQHYTYDNGGINPTNIVQLLKDNNTSLWNNVFHLIRTYNVDDKLESDISQSWDGTQWVNSFKQEYTYDGSGNNDVITSYNYDGIGMNWLVSWQELKTYNGSDLITENIWQQWSGSFTNSYKIIYTYTADLLVQKNNYNWIVSDWAVTAYLRNTYTYNGSDNVETDLSETNNGGGWTNNYLQTYTYTGDNFSEIIVQTWSGSWVNSNQLIISYDVNDLFDEVLTNSWSTSIWEAQNKNLYFWSDSALSISSNNLLKGKAYPNPFKSELNISLQSALESQGMLQIFDVHGKEISNTEINQGVKTIKINNPYLSKGMYFVKVTSATQNQTFKVIKQ